MVRQNMLDIATDLLKKRVQNGFQQMDIRYKGTNPYRKEPVSPRKLLSEYYQLGRNKEMMLRAQLGDEKVNNYIIKMMELEAKYGGL